MEPIETIAWHEIIDHGELHDWRVAQLARLGFPGPWRGCRLRLALNIVL